MRKSELNKIIDEGIGRNRQFLAVKIFTDGNPTPEIIVNQIESVSQKRAYYNRAYNDDLELIAAKNNGKLIRIDDALMTSNLNDLSWFVY